MMDLSIITVTYNSQNTIKEFISSLLKYKPENCEIIILDNNSQDNTVNLVEGFPKVILIKSKENLGFSKGCNLGAKKAKGRLLLFLNPDIIVSDDSINRMIHYTLDHNEVGILVPKLFESDGKVQESVTKLPTLIGAIKEYILGIKYSYKQYAPQTDKPINVEAAYGAVMMLKKEVFEKVHKFDERYFLYYEDLDLCKKVNNLGLNIVYNPETTFIHNVGSSAKQVKVSKLPFGIRTLANFIPLKSTGAVHYQVRSGYIYLGAIKGFLIRLIIYLSIKLRLSAQ